MIGPGGIDSSNSSTRNTAETAQHPPLAEGSDDEMGGCLARIMQTTMIHKALRKSQMGKIRERR